MTGSDDRFVHSIDSIGAYRAVNNKVIVRIDFDPDKATTPGGIYMGSSYWDEAGHVPRYGVVVGIPDKLFFREDAKFGIEWGTNIEVSPGDTVYFGKMASYASPVLKDKDGSVFYVIDYSEIIIRARGEEIYPLNGYVIVEKIEETVGGKGLILDFSKKQNKTKGIVKYVGRPVDYYFPLSAEIPEPSVSAGDKVIFSLAGWTELEDQRYSSLKGDLGYIQSRWIAAAYED
jgi:co-chaperonin GroES (HSP10)